MPKLGESVTEGTISTWLIEEGDVVNKYDPIAEVMTDKVNAEIPSSFSGTINELVAKEGDVIKVGELICYVETANDSLVSLGNNSNQYVESIDVSNDHDESKISDSKSMRSRYSPAVLHLAHEHNVPLNEVAGTGLGGRITRKDIKKYIKMSQSTKSDQTPSSKQQTNDQNIEVTNIEDVSIPVSAVRKTIADHMVKAKREIPHAWMTVEADVTGLVRYREQIKDSFRKSEGYGLTYFAFFIHAVARALKEFPQLNSVWAGDHIIQKKEVNISIAVANENELFVPVIKHADEKSVQKIAKDIMTLATKARSNKLTVDDMQGGTFTVNNTGTFGSVSSMGIINYPQAAILQVESIVKRPVIIQDMFAARDMVNLSLSLDHRILDGLICGRFLAYVKEMMENIDENSKII